MSKTTSSIWDDIVEAGREVLREIEETLNPQKRRKPARVPVPIRSNYPPRENNDNDYR